MTSRFWPAVFAAVALAVWQTGCNPSGEATKTGDEHGEHEHGDHDHGDHEHGEHGDHEHGDKAEAGHDHGEHAHHHHGPHGGEIMVIGNEEYHAEWTQDSSTGKVTFYILDAAAKNEVPIEAEKITITTKVGSSEPTTYELVAVNPQGEPLKTAQFEIVDQNIEGVLSALSKEVTATLHVTIDGKSFDQPIEKHTH